MTLNDVVFLPLVPGETDFSNFDCGRDDINDFFLNDASDYQEELFGKTYVFVPEDTPTNIVAAFTVANASIFTKRLPNARKKKIGYEVHQSKGLINYPAVLLGRLGVDLRYQHAHLGPQIIDFVAQWFTSDDNKSGCRHLIVDAYNEPGLIDFYQRNGLKLFFSTEQQEREYRALDVNTSEKLGTRLMYRDLVLLKRNSLRAK